MSIKRASTVALTPMRRTVWVFALPGILPERTYVLLDVRSRTAMLLQLDGEEPVSLLHTFQLAPSATRVFLALLQAYPHYCPHRALLAALYPTTQENPVLVWEQHVRPIRRAIHVLAPTLQAFGLEVVALRRHGYLLAPATPSAKKSGQHRTAS